MSSHNDSIMSYRSEDTQNAFAINTNICKLGIDTLVFRAAVTAQWRGIGWAFDENIIDI